MPAAVKPDSVRDIFLSTNCIIPSFFEGAPMKNLLTKYSSAAVIATFFCFLLTAARATTVDMGIVTGGTKGTYIQIGYDISKLVKKHGIQLTVLPSKGSLDNIADVYERKDVQLGIVQSDILAFIRSSDNNTLKDITKNIKMLFPLYNEEMHLLANPSITSFADLNGKRIAIGPEGSGTALTASLLLKLTGVSPAETIYANAQKALMQLRSENIDAMFHIAGYPVTLFSKIFTEKLHLVPLRDQRIGKVYIPSVIPANTYRWQEKAVDTFAVKAVLMAYGYDTGHPDCTNVGKVGEIIYSNMGWLKKNGHLKWADVNPDDGLIGWEQYTCVADAIKELKADKKAAPLKNPEEDVSLKNFLQENSTETAE